MPSKTGKAPAEYYKNDLTINQATNTGIDATTRLVHDGAGQSTAISLSDDVLSVQPVVHDSVGTMLVKNNAGNNILAVDTTNSKLLGGASQTALNTQYANFGINSTGSSAWSADTHYAVPFSVNLAPSSTATALAIGSSTSSSFNDTNPATSLAITTTAHSVLTGYWYVMDNITVDSVVWFHAADASAGEDTAAHMMSYTVDIANGSTSGDLSSGVVVADGANITNAGYEQIYYQSMTVQSADVDAGKVILFTFASESITADYSINATAKYHIR